MSAPRNVHWFVVVIVVLLLAFTAYFAVTCLSPGGCTEAGSNISRVIVGILRFFR